MEMFLSDEELQLQFQTVDFILKTQQQISKDFYSSSIQFEQSFETTELAYQEILEEVATKLEEIIRLGETQLLQLLYQIDISQNQFLKLVNREDFLFRLSELIVRREAYKVFLRSKF